MIFCEGLEHPEAPVLMADGQWLVAQMMMGTGCVSRINGEGSKVITVKETGRPNGLLVSGDGCIWVAESWEPSLIKITPESLWNPITSTGETSCAAEHCSARVVARGANGRPFLWPNDLVFGPDGAIYMTDSGLRVNELLTASGPDPQAWKGWMSGSLYRIDPVTETVECLDSGFRFLNGLAFGPDRCLYVAETVTGVIYRYEFTDSLQVSSRMVFAEVIDPSGHNRVVGPDGMAFDEQGTLYIALFGQGHIATVDPCGRVRRDLVTCGSCPTNVAFGPKGSHRLYVTEYQRGRIEMLEVPCDGFDSALLALRRFIWI